MFQARLSHPQEQAILRFRNPLVCAVILLILAAWQPVHARQHRPLAASTEIVVVTTSGWDAVSGTLRRYERAKAHGRWKAVGLPVEVVVGKNGLGWGAGISAADSTKLRTAADPVKKEGDGKAPAGIFRLSKAFGYAADSQPGWKMPYLASSPSVECVDDTSSKFYNRVLDRGTVTPDWNSSEHMLRPDELYRWGIIVDHNSDPPAAGSGSCIFMHIWRGPGQGTVGCTAMPQPEVESLLGWLDPARTPLLVQLPEAEYKKLRSRWKLPRLGDSTR
jgi:D-alanyl-D-alanine dipeptidase